MFQNHGHMAARVDFDRVVLESDGVLVAIRMPLYGSYEARSALDSFDCLKRQVFFFFLSTKATIYGLN
jgi:hypothetical protein